MQTEATTRQRVTSGDILVAGEIGALATAALLKASQHVAPSLYAALFKLKMLFSDLLGVALGWSGHVRYHDRVGAWLQFLVLTAALGAMSLQVIRASTLRASRAWLDGLTAVAAPWIFFAITFDSRLVGKADTERVALLVGVLTGIGLGTLAAFGVGHGVRRNPRILIGACIVGSLGVCVTLVHFYVDVLAVPVGYGIALASAILLYSGAFAREGQSQAGV